tara:strand:- start:3027 stop:5591 length:2565 start_codon:yes stop_codon:yes gene_type:complete
MKSPSDFSIKKKVWVTFIIIILVIGGGIYWSYESYQKLSHSINLLSQPDEKTPLIQKTIQGITKAENYIQYYILSNDDNAYTAYQNEIKQTQLSIDELKKRMTQDSLQIQRIDSLEILFLQKLNYLSDFLLTKKNRQTKNFSNEALEKITESTEDSASTESKVLAKIKTTEETKPTIKHDLVATEYKEPGLWEGVKRLFGAKNIRVDTITTVQNDTLRTTEVVIDTLTLVNYNPDSMLLKVKEILQQVANQEFRSQYNLSSKELNLLRQDMRLRAEIDEIIQQLQNYEQQLAAKKRQESYQISRDSTFAVLIIGILGIGLGGFFLVAIGKDLTNSYYLSKRLELEKNKANRLAKVKEEFLANMSHEIRNPLNSILGFSDLIKNTKLNETQRKYSNALSESTEYLMTLVNDILDFSKLDSGKVSLQKKPFYIPDLVNQMEDIYALQCQEKELNFLVSYDPELQHIDLIGDEFRIKQILINLLSNAVKFTHRGQVALQVSAQKKHDKYDLTIRVKDSGKGIAPDKLKGIFNSFEQEDASVTKQYGGTGLGLAIVKKLVEAMKGKISVESHPDQETTFTLKLKLPYQKHIVEAQKLHSENLTTDITNIHVVVIEDDHWNATLLKTILQPKVNKLTVFESGTEALDFIREEHQSIQLILTDINMPQLSGIEILKEVGKINNELPIVAVTAHSLPQQLKEFKSMGFSAVLTKPYQELAIDQILKDMLHHSNSANSNAQNNVDSVTTKFNFDRIKQFSGDDDELLADLVRELIRSNDKNVSDFNQFLESKNLVLLANTAHKMVQTYDSINHTPISETLKSIEVYHQLGKHEKMLETAHELLPTLIQMNKELLALKSQCYT